MKDIPGFEGQYAITSCGKVWSYKRKIFLKPCYRKGYLQVSLCKDGKQRTFQVHRLVAMAYIPNPDNLPFVNHIDEVKDHNWVSNLEWCTAKYNSNYRNAQSDKKIKVRCIETGQIYDSITEAANAIKRTKSALSHCICGASKTCGRYHWEVLE